MRYRGNSSSGGNSRLLHVMEGVLNQTLLQRELVNRGVKASMNWKGYRETDIFDFSVGGKKYDVKTFVVYDPRDSPPRRRFSPDLLIENRSNPGPVWYEFFPAMVTLSQLTIARPKDGYVFGVGLSSENLVQRVPERGDGGYWCSVPHSSAFQFLHSTPLILARESAGRGFLPVAKWRREQARLAPESDEIELTYFGEWAGERKEVRVRLKRGGSTSTDERFSALSCVRVDSPALLEPSDVIEISVHNEFRERVPSDTDPTLDLNDSSFSWNISVSDFINLNLPENYKVYWIGHIDCREFAKTFARYPCYFQPHPKDPDRNVPGKYEGSFKLKLDRMDRKRAKALASGAVIDWPDFASLADGTTLHAGILVAVQGLGGRNLGAACYYYPPYGFYESAMYVLPADLDIMSTLK